MELKLLFSLALIVASIGLLRPEKYAGISAYDKCAQQLFDIEKEQGCPQVASIMTCLEDLMTVAGLRPDLSKAFCHDEEAYPYCSMLDGSLRAPMVRDPHPSLCSIYVRIRACQENECGPEGKKFYNPHDRFESSSGTRENSCPIEATVDCIQPVRQVAEVNKDSCIAVAEAKSCYVDRLNDCSGTGEQQHAVDILLAGLVAHVQQCRAQEIGFSRDGDICVPNPLDVYLPGPIKDNLNMNPFVDEVEKEKALQAFLKTNCPVVEEVGTNLETYMKGCNVTSHNRYEVAKVIDELNGPRLHCMKLGYNLPAQCDCSGNHGVKGEASGPLAVLALLLVCLKVKVL